MKTPKTSPMPDDHNKGDITISQNKIVLQWLKSGNTLTASQAANYMGIYRLSARIYDLHRQGHPIKSELHFDKSAHWSVYTLNHKP